MTPSTFRPSDIHVLLMLPVEVQMAYDEGKIYGRKEVCQPSQLKQKKNCSPWSQAQGHSGKNQLNVEIRSFNRKIADWESKQTKVKKTGNSFCNICYPFKCFPWDLRGHARDIPLDFKYHSWTSWLLFNTQTCRGALKQTFYWLTARVSIGC